MEDRHIEFMEKLADVIRGATKDLKLAGVTFDRDEGIVLAEPQPFRKGLNNALLVLNTTGMSLRIQARRVFYCGSKGSLANRVVSHFLEKLFVPGKELTKVLDDKDQMTLMGITADHFRKSQHEIDVLLSMLVAASNSKTILTRAVVDPDDGEVYVDFCVKSDFEVVHPKLVDLVAMVLDHAAQIYCCNEVIRTELVTEFQPSSPWVEKLLRLNREHCDLALSSAIKKPRKIRTSSKKDKLAKEEESGEEKNEVTI